MAHHNENQHVSDAELKRIARRAAAMIRGDPLERCPKCRRDDTEPRGDSKHYCNTCKSYFIVMYATGDD